MPRYKFKAKPLNEKIMKNPDTKIKKTSSKELTRPEGFDLETQHRASTKHNNSSKEEEEEAKAYKFQAQPLPKKILEGVTVSNVLSHNANGNSSW